TAVAGVYRGKTEDQQHPFVRCVALSDEHGLIAVSILEKESVVVSLDTRRSECVTTVNIKVKIECQISHRTAEVYATFQNLTAGETRTYTCRRTYFDVRTPYKDEQISISPSEDSVDDRFTSCSGSSSESVSSCMVASLVILVLLLFALVAVSTWFLHYRGALRCPFPHGEHAAATEVHPDNTHRQNPAMECTSLMGNAPHLEEPEKKVSGESGDSGFGQPQTSENGSLTSVDRGEDSRSESYKSASVHSSIN
ncbi:hypothetical protein BaRGS_00016644, partial [Batillaria attramentaria]